MRDPCRIVGAAFVFVPIVLWTASASAQIISPRTPTQGAQTSASAGHEWTLAEVLSSALAQHPLVESARAQADAARGNLQTARLFPNPVGTYWSENSTFPGARAPVGVDLETSAYMTLPIEPFFQRSPKMRGAEEGLRDAEASIATARREVALGAARAFFQVAVTQAAVDAARENRAALEQLASFSGSRVSEGMMAEVDLMRVQVELDRASAEVTLAEADLARGRAELRSFVVGASAPAGPVDEMRVNVPAAPDAGTAVGPLDELLSRARTSRPELLSARARLAVSEATVRYERSLAVRQVGATFGLKRSAGQNSLVAGVAMAIPLFDRNQGGIARATAEGRAAGQEIAWRERTIASEVQAAYEAAQRLSTQIAALRPQFLQRAETVHRITLAAYQEGGASLLQVLDASRTLAEARLIYARTVFAGRQNVFELALAVGTDPSAAATTFTAASRGVTDGPGFDGARQ